MNEDQREEVTTLVGNALTALDDPVGLGMDEHTPVEERINFAIGNLCVALRILEPETYGDD